MRFELLLATELMVVSTLQATQKDYDRGYLDGQSSLKKDKMFNQSYKNYREKTKGITDPSDLHVARAGLSGAMEGSCMRLTYSKDSAATNKSYDYVKGFYDGCMNLPLK